VPLSTQDVELFYEEVSNGVLWPVCHDRLDRVALHMNGWEVYESVNRRFAETVAAAWRPGDLIWVHDYQLMRLPSLLRERLPDARIGFFLHVPFPNPDVFAVLPRREWLLRGLLGADLIGFQTPGDRANFEATVWRFCGVEFEDHAALHKGGHVRVGSFPMGIDGGEIAARSNTRQVSAKTLEFRTGARRLILGIDRLD
jgi:trehalose 6-phosphate synthase/phosphatase